jgi:hypothetical protein
MTALRTVLKITGFSSAARLEDIFGSSLVDIAYLVEVQEDAAIAVPDDPERLDKTEGGYEWLERAVLETLQEEGEPTVSVSVCRVPGE